MRFLVILLFVTYVRTQQNICSCSCCTGQNCRPVFLGNSPLTLCTTETCRTYCRGLSSACQIDEPNGQISATCLSDVNPSYQCQCDCCNTGSALCTPAFVGYAAAFACESSLCSIACFNQYKNQCISDQNGQTNGTCIGLISTTTTTTTNTIVTTSSYGHTCSCMCCQSGSNCSPNIDVGTTSAAQCSSTACTQACKDRYPILCPSMSALGQTNGTCPSQYNGKTRCKCQCCDANGCPSSEIITDQDCTSCYRLCRQDLSCGNTINVTQSCTVNQSKQFMQSPVFVTLFTSIMIISSFFYF